MSHRFTSQLPLSRYAIDRDYRARNSETLFDDLWADPATRVLPLFQSTALMASATSLALLPVAAVPASEIRVYLGRSTTATRMEPVGTPIVAVELQDAGHFTEGEWATLRSVGEQLDDRDAGMFTEAVAILNWHRSHGFSPRTGTRTLVQRGGWARRDAESGIDVFPRTDPAIIVGIVDEHDRMLLGSNALWESNRYSLLAGFVEPGESLEAAVIREVFEEAGITVVDSVYLGSQPWPFPASLMLGFMARLDPDVTNETVPDGDEILDLRWFSREELAASLGDILLPGRISIARAIIEEWYGGRIDDGQ